MVEEQMTGSQTPTTPPKGVMMPFPTRPARSNFGAPVNMYTNSYRLQINPSAKHRSIEKYAIKFEPEIPDTSRVNRKVTALCNETLKEKFDFRICFGNNLYAVQLLQDDIVCEVEFDEQPYKVTFSWAKSISEKDPELYTFYSVFFKNIMRRLNFERVGRNCFNPKKAKVIQGLEVWPGFYSSIQKVEEGALIQIDLTSKVIRKDTLMQHLEDYQKKNKDHDFINMEIKGLTVVTTYGTNKKTYQIEKIDFEKSPMSTFDLKKEETTTTFQDYYRKKYSVDIRDLNQPLAVTKDQRTGMEIVLIPELCEMTGLTDTHRANFNLMRDLGTIMHKGGKERMDEVKHLMDEIFQQEKVKELTDQWQIGFDRTPLKVTGQRIPAGNIKMGGNQQFPADCNPNDFDRKIQAPMLKAIPLNKWAIIHSRFTKKEADVFSGEMKKCCETFKYNIQPPRLIEIQGNDREFSSWERCLRQNLNPSVQCVVLILAGKKNAAPMYDQIKKLLIRDIPVPSQVVLQSTISRGKNVRSICNKILIQINAKLGGEPWGISQMPLMNKPCMIIGYDVFHKRGKKSSLAFCATVNSQGTKYWSRVVEQDEMQEIAKQLEQVMVDALAAFKSANGIFPAQLIFIRDGVGDSQKQIVVTDELNQIKAALARDDSTKNIKILFMMVNKRVKTKMIAESNGRIQNPQPGTVLDHSITPNGLWDFYMVSVSTRQGVPTPSHYSVLYNNMGATPEEVMALTYKLCYTYYNYGGPVKIPAPVKYADKLAGMVGERGGMQPHKHFENIKGLYFI